MGGYQNKPNASATPPAGSVIGPLPVSDSTVPSACPTVGEEEEGMAADAVKSLPVSSTDAPLKMDCEKALAALRRGNHKKALRLMKEACDRHKNSALFHRTHGAICLTIASLTEDKNAKQRYLKNAIDATNNAIALSPNSIEFAHFYANLLFVTAIDGRGHGEVIQECERALTIHDPVDPAKESLLDESQQEYPTSEARITYVKRKLKSLIQKTNITSISIWMKYFRNDAGGEEKVGLIPIQPVVINVSPELGLSLSRRPNEIKKVIKTPEERRKEIEVRVAAARILQQRPDFQTTAPVDKAPKPGLRRGDSRRKTSNSKKMPSSERSDKIRSFWKSMNVEKRLDLLKVNIDDLKTHCTSLAASLSSPLSPLLKDGAVALDLLQEAISFGCTNKTWRFWSCCCCGAEFVSSESHMHHVREHTSTLAPHLEALFPQEVDKECVDLLLNGNWLPIDVDGASKLLSITCDHDGVTESNPSTTTESSGDKSKEDAFLKKPQNCTWADEIEEQEKEGNREIAGSDSKIVHSGLPFRKQLLSLPWPPADDDERLKLLERIHSSFQSLIKYKCLAASHLNKVVQYVMEDLQGLRLGHLANEIVGLFPLCIRFLGVAQLHEVFNFLQALTDSCELSKYDERDSSGDTIVKSDGDSARELIVLSDDLSFLILDGQSLCDPTVEGIDGREREREDEFNNSDNVLLWILSKHSAVDQMVRWQQDREEKVHAGQEILQMLDKELNLLQSVCDKKREHLNYEQALNNVENLCTDALKRREVCPEVAPRSYEAILKKWKEDIAEGDLSLDNSLELDVISKILQESQILNVEQDDNVSSVNSRVCDVENVADGERKVQDFVNQIDSCTEFAIQRQKERLSLELNVVDARIMQHAYSMHQLEIKMSSVSALDYHTLLVPLIKSFLQAHLDELVEKDATEKSDAAREAFLAELALDKQKHSAEDGDIARVKDKKKRKARRRSKDPKVLRADDSLLSGQDPESMVADSNASQESGSIATSEDCYLKIQEEERQWMTDLETEERKLEQALDFQSRIEEEAKQRLFEDQNKKCIQKCADDAEGETLVLDNKSIETKPLGKMVEPLQKTVLHDKSSTCTEAIVFGTGVSGQVSSPSSLCVSSTKELESPVGRERKLFHRKNESSSTDKGSHIQHNDKPSKNLSEASSSRTIDHSLISPSYSKILLKGPAKKTFSGTKKDPGLTGGDVGTPFFVPKARKQAHKSKTTSTLRETKIDVSLPNKGNHGLQCLESETLFNEQSPKGPESIFRDGNDPVRHISQPDIQKDVEESLETLSNIHTVEVDEQKFQPDIQKYVEENLEEMTDTLRHIHTVEVDEQRFQPDIHKAVKKSRETMTDTLRHIHTVEVDEQRSQPEIHKAVEESLLETTTDTLKHIHTVELDEQRSQPAIHKAVGESLETTDTLRHIHTVEVDEQRSQPAMQKAVQENVETMTDTLRQIHIVEVGEQKSQPDIRKAVEESLDSQAQNVSQTLDLVRLPKGSSTEMVSNQFDHGVTDGVTAKADVLGAGLKNEMGEYNCFLNVIIQSLWHIKRFQDEFLTIPRSAHMRVGEPCVVCALHDIFSAMSMEAVDTQKETISLACLRIALSKLYPDSNFFQEAQMNDASEVLAVIFDCLHRSCTVVSDAESEGRSSGGSWDCTNNACIAHSIFGMDVYQQMHCCSCGMDSRHFKYTSFFHNINANALRTMKCTYADLAFDDLLKLVEMNHRLNCDPEAGGCGKPNCIHHALSGHPHIFTIVLGWQTTSESTDDISATLGAITMELDVGVIYQGLAIGRSHRVVSVVCYYGQHYHCFAYNHAQKKWIMYDDATVKVIGDWNEVLDMCYKGHLQPQILFYQAKN